MTTRTVADQRKAFAAATREAFRLAFEAVQQFPTRMLRAARSMHNPYDVMGDQSVAICRLCNVEWPCDEFVRLDEALTEALAE